MMTTPPILMSTCLLGVRCRYDGSHQERAEMIELLKNENVIPVCGEQMGGLTTPREPSEEVNGKILSISGKDVSHQFHRGAEDILKLAKIIGAKKAYLKTDSPMCGCGKIYDGTFSGVMINGDGELTKLLKKNDIEVIPVE
ncbi:MAG: DUF523 domain-containing protein [Bacteriovoracaceae bacterium]|nr:DUF523 domain-containing protein [Bacteriovoracaceae bacterium]